MNANNSNVSALFNSLNANSGAGSFNFADYAAIKNGSYGKLVKAYYSEGTKIDDKPAAAVSKKAASQKATEAKKTENAAADLVKKDADKLRTDAEALNKDELWTKNNGKADMGKIAEAVSDFADSYNKVIEGSSKIKSKEASRDVDFMTGLTNTFSKVLQKAGITVGTDGKLSVNEDALKKADQATLRSLFDGVGTYGSQIAEKAESIERHAEPGSIYGSDATVSSALSGVYNQFI
ncbi:MAG: hypothetical protein K6G58_08985 [Lachnospiraceae bacterium]|nr:hypothetical protein [Lachnospiraceae bacterium]